MPDAIFADSRLASLYDAFDGPRDDLAGYLQIVDELGARDVLDLGCGTGSLALLLAERGCQVVAVDPAGASLDVARAKAGAELVTWIHGDAAEAPPTCFDVAVMTGNVAQVFLTDDEWTSALAGARAALRDGGRLVFETRRPADRAWERWAAEPGPVVRNVPAVGPVEQRLEVTDIEAPLVSFRHTFSFADGLVLTSRSTLRFRELDEIERDLAVAGFALREVRDAADRPGREYVVIAQLDGSRRR